jgi:TP901 family phage tail tape measure protein
VNRVFQIAFELSGRLRSTFGSSISKAESQLAGLKDSMKGLKQTERDIKSFERITGRVKEASEKAAQAEALLLAKKERTANKIRTDREVSSIQNAERKVSKLNDKLREENALLEKMQQKLKLAGVETLHLATAKSTLTAQLQHTDRAMATLGTGLGGYKTLEERLESNRQRRRQQWGGIAETYAMTYVATRPLKIGAEYEQEMASVLSVLPELKKTSAEFLALNDLALKLGSTTTFAPAEVGRAMKYLAQAGYSIQEVTAALPATLNLAIAGELDLSRATDIATGTARAFNLDASDTGRVVDALAKAVNVSTANMEDLAESLKYVAPLSAEVGLSVEKLTSLLSLLADVQIRGSMAGTSLRTGFLRLTSGAPMVTKALKEIAVSTADARGNFKQADELLVEIARKTRYMPSQPRLSLFRRLFGLESATAFSRLVRLAGSEKIAERIREINNAQGSAAEMAARLRDTLGKDWKLLTDNLKTFSILITQAFAPILRPLLQGLTDLVKKVNEFTKEHPNWAAGIMSVVSAFVALKVAIAALSFAFLLFEGGLLATRLHLFWLLKDIALVDGALTVLGGTAAAGKSFFLIAFLKKLIDWTKSAASYLWGAAALLGKRAWAWIAGTLWPLIAAHPVIAIVAAVVAALGLLIWKWKEVKAFFADLPQTLSEAFRAIKDSFYGMLTWLHNQIGQFLKAGSDLISALVRGIKSIDLGAALGSALKWLFIGPSWEEQQASLKEGIRRTFGTKPALLPASLVSSPLQGVSPLPPLPSIPAPAALYPSSASYQISLSPTVHFHGDVSDRSSLEDSLDSSLLDSEDRLKKMLLDLTDNDKRVSYAY